MAAAAVLLSFLRSLFLFAYDVLRMHFVLVVIGAMRGLPQRPAPSAKVKENHAGPCKIISVPIL